MNHKMHAFTYSEDCTFSLPEHSKLYRKLKKPTKETLQNACCGPLGGRLGLCSKNTHIVKGVSLSAHRVCSLC